MIFKDRHEAGKLLARKLKDAHDWADACILALPKGGVPVAWEVSQELKAPLDLLFVKKIGFPGQEELAIGAVSEDGEVIWLEEMPHVKREPLAVRAKKELAAKTEQWRRLQPALPIRDQTAIIVDDGLATGATMKAAIQLVKKRGAKRVVVAVPVAATTIIKEIRQIADELFILAEPTPFFSVGQWYEDFEQVSDEQVENLLKGKNGHASIRDVVVNLEGTELPGSLAIPEKATGVVIFAHGSGSSHKSPRNQKVSKALNDRGFATLLFDLLTDREAQYRPNVFNIDLLAERLQHATHWVRSIGELKNLPVGYFGASTGAAAALTAAANTPGIRSVVSRGGRPDMAAKDLPAIKIPVLLIVGGDDHEVITLNEKAKQSLSNARISIIPGAGHLFEEPGTLDEVIELATDWFHQTLREDSQHIDVQPHNELVNVTKKLANPMLSEESIHDFAGEIAKYPIVMLGEATHGTEEFYEMRQKISRELIAHYGFKFVAVEGDWPDCDQLNQYVQAGHGGSAAEIMSHFKRWPSWMWANTQTAEFIEWLKGRNTGFYGLDVYSLFESMDLLKKYADKISTETRERVTEAFSCFESFHRDEIAYARSLMKLPTGCTAEVTKSLRAILRLRIEQTKLRQSELFNLRQNAKIMNNADRYYRAMIEGDTQSWNIRDEHMLETLDSLMRMHGPGAKGIVWAHNTHIGDYHATDMAQAGYVNLGGLAREKWGVENVCLVGFGTYEGNVLAGRAWGAKPEIMKLPPAPVGTLEAYLHQVAQDIHSSTFFVSFDFAARKADSSHAPLPSEQHATPVLALPHGHRAVGVVYQGAHESRRGQYVPTKWSERYDRFIFIDKTTALRALPSALEKGLLPETWPASF